MPDPQHDAGVPCAFPLGRQFSLAARCHPGDGDGPLILALHGFLGSGADWRPVRQALRRQRCTGPFWAVDLPGHGASRLPDPDRHPHPAAVDRFLHPLLEGVGGPDRPFWLVGYSLGGRLALQCALNPVLVRYLAGLVLISAGPGLGDPAARSERVAHDADWAGRFRHEAPGSVLADWDRQPVLAESLPADPSERAAYLERRGEQDGRQLAWALEAFSPGRLPGREDRLGGLACPVLWLTGEAERAYTGLARRAAGRCPDGMHRAVAGAGHRLLLEAPEAVAAEIARFVSKGGNKAGRG